MKLDGIMSGGKPAEEDLWKYLEKVNAGALGAVQSFLHRCLYNRAGRIDLSEDTPLRAAEDTVR